MSQEDKYDRNPDDDDGWYEAAATNQLSEDLYIARNEYTDRLKETEFELQKIKKCKNTDKHTLREIEEAFVRITYVLKHLEIAKKDEDLKIKASNQKRK